MPMNGRMNKLVAGLGAVLPLLLTAGCEFQIDTEGTSTTYSDSFWAGPFMMVLGTLAASGGITFFRSRLPYDVRKYGIVAATGGIVFIVLGVGVIGTYVEVSPERLRGCTGVIWERSTYDIRYDELREIHLIAEPVAESDENASQGFLYRFAFKSGKELQIRREEYLRAAEEEFLEYAGYHGVQFIRDQP